ncbi:MAG: hypothetical protein V1808_01155 [Candidatus Daviesbacteria bacterium]
MLDKQKTGLILGAFFALLHAGWAILVALGIAQALMDFIYGLHFMNNPFVISGFSVTTAVMLVIVTGVVGYIFGWLFAYLWNTIKKK